MGVQRTGARTVLKLLKKACELSVTPGFRTGIANIVGPTQATAFFGYWDPFCSFIGLLVSGDNFFNQIDTVPEETGDEDIAVE
jgi:hypothetical protein